MINKISVILSVYNSERFLKESIESILNQTYKDFEFIIINDGSTDRTKYILNQYKKHSKIKILENSTNIGLTKSLNKAISIAQGKFIARMDADDVSLPTRLEKQADFLEKNPKVGVVGSNYYEIDEKGKKIGEVILPSHDAQIRKVIFRFNPINHSTVMIRKKVFDELGLYNEHLRYAQDYELWFRILNNYEVFNLSEKLLLKRNPKDSITMARKREQMYYSSVAWKIGTKYLKAPLEAYIYYLKFKLFHLIPPFMIPFLRFFSTKERHRRLNKYYIIRLGE